MTAEGNFDFLRGIFPKKPLCFLPFGESTYTSPEPHSHVARLETNAKLPLITKQYIVHVAATYNFYFIHLPLFHRTCTHRLSSLVAQHMESDSVRSRYSHRYSHNLVRAIHTLKVLTQFTHQIPAAVEDAGRKETFHRLDPAR